MDISSARNNSLQQRYHYFIDTDSEESFSEDSSSLEDYPKFKRTLTRIKRENRDILDKVHKGLGDFKKLNAKLRSLTSRNTYCETKDRDSEVNESHICNKQSILSQIKSMMLEVESINERVDRMRSNQSSQSICNIDFSTNPSCNSGSCSSCSIF